MAKPDWVYWKAKLEEDVMVTYEEAVALSLGIEPRTLTDEQRADSKFQYRLKATEKKFG